MKRTKYAFPSITWAKVENRIEGLKNDQPDVLKAKIKENIYNIKNFYFEHRYLEHVSSNHLFMVRKKCDEFLSEKINIEFKSNDNSVCYGLGKILYENLGISLMDAGNPNVWTFLSTCFLPDYTRWRWKDSTNNREIWGQPEVAQEMQYQEFG